MLQGSVVNINLDLLQALVHWLDLVDVRRQVVVMVDSVQRCLVGRALFAASVVAAHFAAEAAHSQNVVNTRLISVNFLRVRAVVRPVAATLLFTLVVALAGSAVPRGAVVNGRLVATVVLNCMRLLVAGGRVVG